MDNIRWIQLYDMVKVGIPGTTLSQLKEFILAQDQDRQRWLDTENFMDVADWVVATMREQSRE